MTHRTFLYDVTFTDGRTSVVSAHRVVVGDSGALMFAEDGWTRLAAPGTWTTVVRRRSADEEGVTDDLVSAAAGGPAPVGDAAGDDDDNPDNEEDDSDDRA